MSWRLPVQEKAGRPNVDRLPFCCPFRAGLVHRRTQGFYEPTFVKSVNLGVISGGLRREETKRTRS